MGSLSQGDLVSSPNMAEQRQLQISGTPGLCWREGVSLEIKYVKSCGAIMAGLIQLAQGEVHPHTHTNVLSTHTHTYYTHTIHVHTDPHTPFLLYA